MMMKQPLETRRFLFVILCIITLIFSCSAGAEAKPLKRTPLSIALEHAYQLWGTKPCGGHYRVEMTILPEWAGGHASWNSPTGPDVYTSPSTTWTECVIQLPSEDWTAEQISIEWSEDCTDVLHEWGHLTGHPHSDVEGEAPEPPGMTPEQLAVMRSGLKNDSDDVRRCGLRP